MLSVLAGDLLVDFSRQRVDSRIVELLLAAADECGVDGAVQRMFAGERLNTTEDRAVGHVALRMEPDESFSVDGRNVVPSVHSTLEAMSRFAEGVRSGAITGSTGRPFTAVVNIGIGGSDLGPRLVHDALRSHRRGSPLCRFAANVDPSDLDAQLSDLDPTETLFVVSSKTFTTTETLLNARAAASWIAERLGAAAVAEHVVAVSADERAVRSSGLGARAVFPLWDWVGGRFSLGSAVGLSAMIAIGSEAFREILAGMRDLDRHIVESRPLANAPLLMALIGIWNRAVLGSRTRAVLPYAHDLRMLPAYLQQLIMESNGKSVRTDGSPVGLPTAPIIWGDAGTNAQHAFMQLVHQGSEIVPVDFIGFASPSMPSPSGSFSSAGTQRQRVLFMNMVAQAQALAFGRTHGEPHRVFSGNRPSTVIVAPVFTPRVLGQIVALYEHAVFYEGVLLGINSFDQWGVELGKQMAADLMTSDGGAFEIGQSGDSTSVARTALLDWFDANSDQNRM